MQIHQIRERAAFEAGEDDVARVGIACAFISKGLVDGHITWNALAGWVTQARKGQA